MLYNRRFVNVVLGPGAKKGGYNKLGSQQGGAPAAAAAPAKGKKK